MAWSNSIPKLALFVGVVMLFQLYLLRDCNCDLPYNQYFGEFVGYSKQDQVVTPPDKRLVPNTFPQRQPKPGLIYYFHVGKTGGTFLYYCFKKMEENRDTFRVIEWSRAGLSLEDLRNTLETLSNNNYNNQLTVLEHHHHYPPPSEMMPLLLQHKEYAESRGFRFDIIITLRHTIDQIISNFNYEAQYYDGASADDFIEFAQVFPNPIATYLFHPSPITFETLSFPFHKVVEEDYYPEKELQEAYWLLDKFDMIFFTDTLTEEMTRYFNCVGIPFEKGDIRGETLVHLVTKEDVSLALMKRIYDTKAIDQFLIAHIRDKIIPKQKIRSMDCFVLPAKDYTI